MTKTKKKPPKEIILSKRWKRNGDDFYLEVELVDGQWHFAMVTESDYDTIHRGHGRSLSDTIKKAEYWANDRRKKLTSSKPPQTKARPRR